MWVSAVMEGGKGENEETMQTSRIDKQSNECKWKDVAFYIWQTK